MRELPVPGHIPGGVTIKEPVHAVDWYPTLVKLAGGSPDSKLPLDVFFFAPSGDVTVCVNWARPLFTSRMKSRKVSTESACAAIATSVMDSASARAARSVFIQSAPER